MVDARSDPPYGPESGLLFHSNLVEFPVGFENEPPQPDRNSNAVIRTCS
uniref:Uncharacterized protein n=1 Tax=Candidatus Kentrum sp. UNK TaxID=2126344 RepID=A0A451ACF6_9GAMM|nr:MAG: hypothetical protein BECKUNK1418G_GA0071005_10362 [Candidatus Kentron sp. UNK]VFK70916.1 MAG: hypothetical protein BECKUNK1418H_GA0071006_10432 [Candidatus Kentron sp. UNK]